MVAAFNLCRSLSADATGREPEDRSPADFNLTYNATRIKSSVWLTAIDASMRNYGPASSAGIEERLVAPVSSPQIFRAR